MILSLLAQYALAVDIKQQGSSSGFQCLKQHYSTVFIRAYNYDQGGSVDFNAVSNINLAYRACLGIEVFMIPDVFSTKSASAQVDEAVSNLVNGGITVRTLLLQARGIRPGVYTNAFEWQQITNSAGNLGTDVMLWYWNVNSMGGETAPDFSDFRPFGNWNIAAVKQFGQNELLCGFTANRDSYPLYSLKKNQLPKSGDDGLIYVGSIGL